MEVEFIIKMKEDFGVITNKQMEQIQELTIQMAKFWKDNFDAKIVHNLDIKGKDKEV